MRRIIFGIIAACFLTGCQTMKDIMAEAPKHVEAAKNAGLKGKAKASLRPFALTFGQSFGLNTGIEADMEAEFDPNEVTERDLFELNNRLVAVLEGLVAVLPPKQPAPGG